MKSLKPGGTIWDYVRIFDMLIGVCMLVRMYLCTLAGEYERRRIRRVPMYLYTYYIY